MVDSMSQLGWVMVPAFWSKIGSDIVVKIFLKWD
jgi:hypothetical protein